MVSRLKLALERGTDRVSNSASFHVCVNYPAETEIWRRRRRISQLVSDEDEVIERLEKRATVTDQQQIEPVYGLLTSWLKPQGSNREN